MPVKTPKAVNRLAQSNGDPAPVIPANAITIPKLRYRTMQITVIGKTELIVHAWSAKAVRQMLGKQTGEASAGRPKKNPLEDFRESAYYLPDNKGFGLPAPCFKAAIVGCANDVEMKQTETKRNCHVNSYLVPIICPPLAKEHWTEWDYKYEKELEWHHSLGCRMRMDLVRLESGVADIRFRAAFPQWKCDLELEFNESVISSGQLVSLVEAAGQGGVGEWRPTSPQVKSGEFGRFKVATSQ